MLRKHTQPLLVFALLLVALSLVGCGQAQPPAPTIKVDGSMTTQASVSDQTKVSIKFTVTNTGKTNIDDLCAQVLDIDKYLTITDPSGNAIDGDFFHFGPLNSGATQTYVVVGYPTKPGNLNTLISFYNWTDKTSYGDALNGADGQEADLNGSITILP